MEWTSFHSQQVTYPLTAELTLGSAGRLPGGSSLGLIARNGGETTPTDPIQGCAPGGIRTPDPLLRRHGSLNGVLSRENAGRSRA
jgi:hypothetical protein